MKRFIVLSISALGLLGLSSGVADAATPANHACLGKSLSALATDQPAPGAFGHGVVSFAQPNGLGGGIQAVLAGGVSDDVLLNTCNDR
jgi:hypothetical protein